MSDMQFELPVQDADGKEIDRVSFPASRLDTHQRSKLLKEAVVMYLANKRRGTHDTKTRGEVAGSTSKPYRQKGTGRARAGTRKSPIWRGGGVIFGPHPRDYSYRINKKQRRLAVRSALFAKFRGESVRVIDSLEVTEPKTKVVAEILQKLGVEGNALIGVEATDRNLWLSTRNIAGVRLLPVSDFNALDVLRAQTVVLTRGALARLIEEKAPEPSTSEEGGE